MKKRLLLGLFFVMFTLLGVSAVKLPDTAIYNISFMVIVFILAKIGQDLFAD